MNNKTYAKRLKDGFIVEYMNQNYQGREIVMYCQLGSEFWHMTSKTDFEADFELVTELGRFGIFKEDKNFVVQIEGFKNHIVKFFPMGGGFNMSCSTSEFFEKFDLVAVVPNETKEGFVVLDDTPKFAASWNPNKRWNGWLDPYFTKDQLKAVVDYLMTESQFWVFDIDKGVLIYTEDCDEPVEAVLNSEDLLDEYNHIIKHESGLYSFNGWCFYEYEEGAGIE